jgi:hypothetical protein
VERPLAERFEHRDVVGGVQALRSVVEVALSLQRRPDVRVDNGVSVAVERVWPQQTSQSQ